MLKSILFASILTVSVAYAVDLVESDRRDREMIAGITFESPDELQITAFQSQKHRLRLMIARCGSRMGKDGNHVINYSIYLFDGNDKAAYDNLICQLWVPVPKKGISGDEFSLCQKIPSGCDPRIRKESFINVWSNGNAGVGLSVADNNSADKPVRWFEAVKLQDAKWIRLAKKGNSSRYVKTALPISKEEIGSRDFDRIRMPGDLDGAKFRKRTPSAMTGRPLQKTPGGWLIDDQNGLTFSLFENDASLWIAGISGGRTFMAVQADKERIITQFDSGGCFSKSICRRYPFEFFSVSSNQKTKYMTRLIFNKLAGEDLFFCRIFKIK